MNVKTTNVKRIGDNDFFLGTEGVKVAMRPDGFIYARTFFGVDKKEYLLGCILMYAYIKNCL